MELETVVQRVRAEFNEMPGLRLTLPQAIRLWGLERQTCEAVIEVLVSKQFLRRASCGTISRLH